MFLLNQIVPWTLPSTTWTMLSPHHPKRSTISSTQTLTRILRTKTTHWHQNGVLDTNTKIQWTSIYSPPTSKKEGDLQYKLLHNILPSLQVLHHLNPAISSTCGWCGDKGTICHLFITCPSIQPLLNCLHSILHRLLPDLPMDFDLYWALTPCVRGRNREDGALIKLTHRQLQICHLQSLSNFKFCWSPSNFHTSYQKQNHLRIQLF